MNIFSKTVLLVVLAACFGGSAWADDSAERCREADAIVASFAGFTGGAPFSLEERVLNLCPDGSAGHFVKAVRYERSGNPELAIAEYRHVLIADDNIQGGATAEQIKATLHTVRGEVNRKMAARRQAEKRDNSRTNSADGDLQEGDAHLLAREYDKAIESYQSVLKEHPEDPDALQKLADALMAAGHDEQATDVYRQLLNVDGTKLSARYTLGVLYERQGMLDEAEVHYRKAVQLDPKNGDARRHLADIYTLRGNFKQAIREYRELLTEHGDNPLLHFKLARAYERNKKYQEAITEYLEAIKLAPNNAETHKELAALYLKRGKGSEAVGQYKAVLLLNKDDVPARNALISLYVKMRVFNELVVLLKEGAERFPDDPDSHFRLGLIYDFQKKYDDSIAEYQKALVLKGDHAKALKGLGKVYLKTGRLKEARKNLEAAKKADPNLLEARELLSDLTKVERKAKIRKNKKKIHRSKKKSVRHKASKKRKSSKKKYSKKKHSKKKHSKKKSSKKKSSRKKSR